MVIDLTLSAEARPSRQELLALVLAETLSNPKYANMDQNGLFPELSIVEYNANWSVHIVLWSC